MRNKTLQPYINTPLEILVYILTDNVGLVLYFLKRNREYIECGYNKAAFDILKSC